MFRKLTIPFVASLLVLWLVLGSWFYGSNYCVVHSGGSVPDFSLVHDGLDITADETFTFFESNPDPNLNKSITTAFQHLANYLRANPEKELTLFGIYSPDESNSTVFDNLGQARADAIRKILFDLGAPIKNIKVKGGLFGNASFTNGMMYGGVFFRFKSVNESPSEPIPGEQNRPTDIFQPVNIYFDVNEYDIILTDELNDYLAAIKNYLQNNVSAKIAIIGHADSKGSGASNLNLSETRARNVKKFMIRSGFKPSKLVIEYKGENDPLTKAQSAEEERKNRRVELRLINR